MSSVRVCLDENESILYGGVVQAWDFPDRISSKFRSGTLEMYHHSRDWGSRTCMAAFGL